jgi:hypothetical protein
MLRPEAPPGSPALAPVADRIGELPHPVRTRILLELAGDLEAFSADLRRSGVPEMEAAARARERVVPSGPALDALVQLHRPLYHRLTAPISDSSLRRWERYTLLGATMAVLGGGLFFLWDMGLLAAPSPILWGILAIAASTLALVLAKGFQLFVRRDHRPGTLTRGLGLLLALSGTAVLVAGAGTVTGLWGLASTMERGVSDPLPLLTAWLLRDSVLVATGLLTALAGGLSWFLLAQGTAAIRGGDEEVRRTLEEGFESPDAEPFGAITHSR